MIRVHVEAAKNTNSVMGGIRVEAMKSHALAESSRVEAMEFATPEKVPFHAGFRKRLICFRERREALTSKWTYRAM